MTTETATPSKKQKKKNCKQLDFLDMIPPEKQTKDSNRQISIADQIEDDLRQRYLLRQELAQRICVKAIPEYGTLDAGILSMIVADQMRTTYDENVSRNEARDYQLPKNR